MQPEEELKASNPHLKITQESFDKLTNRVTWILLILVAVVFLGAAATYYQQSQIKDSSHKNKEALIHLCNTSKSLADVLRAAADQGDANFRKGVYQNLLEKGLITQDNIDAARLTIKNYRNSVAELTRPGNPCERLTDGSNSTTTTNNHN